MFESRTLAEQAAGSEALLLIYVVNVLDLLLLALRRLNPARRASEP